MIITLSLIHQDGGTVLADAQELEIAEDLGVYHIRLRRFIKKAKEKVIEEKLDGSIFCISNATNVIALKIHLVESTIHTNFHKYTVPSLDINSLVYDYLDQADKQGSFHLIDLQREYVLNIQNNNSLPVHKFTESSAWRMLLPIGLELSYKCELNYKNRVDKIKAMKILGIKKVTSVQAADNSINDISQSSIFKNRKRLIVTD